MGIKCERERETGVAKLNKLKTDRTLQFDFASYQLIVSTYFVVSPVKHDLHFSVPLNDEFLPAMQSYSFPFHRAAIVRYSVLPKLMLFPNPTETNKK